MKTKCLIIFLLSSFLFCQGQDDDSSTEYQLLNSIPSIKKKSYRFRILSDGENFKMKVCLNLECKNPYDYKKSMDSNAFVNAVIAQINMEYSDSLTITDIINAKADGTIKEILNEVKAYDEKIVRADLNEAQNRFRDIENAKNRFAGILYLNVDEVIPYRKTRYKLKPEFQEAQLLNSLKAETILLDNNDLTTIENLNETQQEYITIQIDKGQESFEKDSIAKTLFKDLKNTFYYLSVKENRYERFDNKKYDAITENGLGELKIVNAAVHFFNNKASVIIVNAELTDNGVTEELTFLNSRFSVPIRYFNNYGSVVSTNTNSRDKNGLRTSITVDYNDIFDYKQYEDTYSYAVANTQVELGIAKNQQKSAKIVQRRFFDYFTAILYSDLMGFNTEAPNALINAQARLLIPLNLRNWTKWTLGRQLTTITNIALQNSFDDDNRFVNIKNTDQFSNFDLLRKNNLFGKFNLEVLTHEAKGWYTNIALGYSAGFYRTGFRHTQTIDNEADVVTTTQLFSIAHGPFLNFEIRPQTNFGADITFSIEDLNYAGDQTVKNVTINDKINNTGRDHFVMPYNIMNLEANFYWLTNPEKSVGGLYAKLGGYFHTETNTIFPQLMVGYATNLTSFVDKFKGVKKNEDTKPE